MPPFLWQTDGGAEHPTRRVSSIYSKTVAYTIVRQSTVVDKQLLHPNKIEWHGLIRKKKTTKIFSKF